MELFYRKSGTGKPLILLHGNGESSLYFENQIKAFSPYFHVYAPDTRGHGRSPRGDGPFTIRRFAEDLLSFLDDRGIEKAHLLGFSDGGNIALAFVLAHPERIERLILNGANLDPAGIRLRYRIPMEIQYRIAERRAGRGETERHRAELLALMTKDPYIMPEELNAVTIPTLVIAGTRDVIRRRHTEKIAAALPNAELALIPGDHFIAQKNPDAFNKCVLRFLGVPAGIETK